MCAIFGYGLTVVSREKGGTDTLTELWHEWLQDNFYGGSATKRIVIKELSLFLFRSLQIVQSLADSLNPISNAF